MCLGVQYLRYSSENVSVLMMMLRHCIKNDIFANDDWKYDCICERHAGTLWKRVSRKTYRESRQVSETGSVDVSAVLGFTELSASGEVVGWSCCVWSSASLPLPPFSFPGGSLVFDGVCLMFTFCPLSQVLWLCPYDVLVLWTLLAAF